MRIRRAEDISLLYLQFPEGKNYSRKRRKKVFTKRCAQGVRTVLAEYLSAKLSYTALLDKSAVAPDNPIAKSE